MDILLATDRLVLRRFTRSDPDLLVELDSDPEVMRYLTGGRTTPRIRVETALLPAMLLDYERYPGFGAFATHTRTDGEFVGWCMLLPEFDGPAGEAELGYRLLRRAWGRGYATEASRELLRYGFTERKLKRIFAETMAVNTGSRRVMEKAGLRYELTYFPPLAPIEGSEHGEVRYAIDAEEWLQ
ncbi:GNAT family N-acetyltransferase [Actinophytocola sp.]|uniref:GNAT family N-acetyltransferase n=1 Tax=Actinophytocola sp. TaxID=1872138 RepID=UPI003D6A3E16